MSKRWIKFAAIFLGSILILCIVGGTTLITTRDDDDYCGILSKSIEREF